MPGIGRFTSDEAKVAFLRAYDAAAAQWPVPSTDLDIETSFGTTRVRRSGSGDGTPILLLPGLSGNGLMWWPLIEELTRDRVVYTPDVIGWAGRSEQTAPVRDEDDIATWVIELLDALGLDRVHLAGTSVGSWLAIVVGARHSERLASLSMLEPGGATFTKPRWRVLLKFLAAGTMAGIRPSRERMEKFTNWLAPGSMDAFTDLDWTMLLAAFKFRMALPWERPLTDAQLAAVTAPLLVLFGANTVANDPEVGAKRVREHIPSAEIEIYPGVGHELVTAKRDIVIPRFLAFADKHEPVRI
ncbi:alpha/beta fold hydrolase [Nocardia sp. 2]|uniref:Alpha/beta fold hydrolase n=1 Tax=Nocardia acididurans TaxID=2802282 RepID=A0ABS1MDZ0_9NOCA|nr:alpha/beta hydrolase [Nocardia acididurans]MBL1078875.1 alpha/beta fold hydrolase [Nocardia acididurans]